MDTLRRSAPPHGGARWARFAPWARLLRLLFRLLLIGTLGGTLMACDTPVSPTASRSGARGMSTGDLVSLHEWTARTVAWSPERRPRSTCSAVTLAWAPPLAEPREDCDQAPIE